MKVQKQIRFTLILVVTLVFTFTAVMPAGAVWYPNNITALGDSITTAYDSAGFGNQVAYSWSTGTSTGVNSLYLRILAVNPLIRGKATNLAVSGAKMVDLNGQAARVGRKTEYVTILIGANDVCTSSVSNMTSVATFQSQFQAAMKTLTKNAPKAKIYVVSIPDVHNLWYILKDSSSARGTWALFGICQSLLANPLGTTQADVDRRAAVQKRNIELNNVLASVCSTYANCRYDGGAVFRTSFVASDVSTIDYFHPSIAGQAKLALTAWGAAGLPYP